MTEPGLFDRLISRAFGHEPVIEPRRVSRFEPISRAGPVLMSDVLDTARDPGREAEPDRVLSLPVAQQVHYPRRQPTVGFTEPPGPPPDTAEQSMPQPLLQDAGKSSKRVEPAAAAQTRREDTEAETPKRERAPAAVVRVVRQEVIRSNLEPRREEMVGVNPEPVRASAAQIFEPAVEQPDRRHPEDEPRRRDELVSLARDVDALKKERLAGPRPPDAPPATAENTRETQRSAAIVPEVRPRSYRMPQPANVPRELPVPEPVIQISIGRIEVRAANAPPTATSHRPAAPRISLEEYLRRRGGS